MIDIEINRRLVQVMEYLSFTKKGKLTKSAFAEYVGVSPSTIGEITSNTKGVGSSVLLGLSKMNPEINTSWILTGKGSIINGIEEPLSERKHDKSKPPEPCKECEKNKVRIEMLKEINAELKKENNELRNEIAILRNKLNT